MSNNHGDIVIEAPAGYKWDEGTLKKITYVAEAGGVFCHHFLAIEMVGDGGSGFIFAVYAATA